MYIFGVMQDHLNRGNGPMIDEFDRDAFEDCFALLRDRVYAGELKRESPEMYQIGFAIRGKGFRPSYEQIQAIVKEKLKIVDPPPAVFVEGHVAEARTVVAIPPLHQIAGSPKASSARDKALELIRKLNASTKGRMHSHGPDVWTGHGEDPLKDVPEELHAGLLDDALEELYRTGKGRHPNHIRRTAGRLYHASLRAPILEPEPMTPEERADFEEGWAKERVRDERGVPAYMLGIGNEWGKP